MKGSHFFFSTVLISSLISGCNGNGPVNVDWEIVAGKVIGQEDCNRIDSLNAWLITLMPALPKPYGNSITFKGKSYSNVVKSYNLNPQARDTSKTYVFWFYQEDAVPQPVCDSTASALSKVPQIRIKDISLKAQ